MNILNLIEKKKNNKTLSSQEYLWFIESIINNSIPDYQSSSLLMAIYINGLSEQELFDLTDALIKTSGKINPIANNKLKISIDKHSSGGIGDKVSLIISPILVALGYDVVKLSGRGLSFTGGTIDKLESIGINYEYNPDNFQKLLDKVHMLLMIQSDDIVPGDKKIYALRNATGTVDSFPLIASSIMSKKIIIKSDYIFLDIKVGNGAFFKTLEEAERFSKLVLKISNYFNRKTIIHITNMDQPLGRTIGNGIEVIESLNFLKNNIDSKELKELIYELCIDILNDTNVCNSKEEAYGMVDNVIKNNQAYDCFIRFVNELNSNSKVIDNYNFFNPKYTLDIYSDNCGYIYFNDVKEIGFISNLLGAGRLTKESNIDYNAGIKFYFDPYQYVNKNEKIATLYSNNPITNTIIDKFNQQVVYSKSKPKIEKIILSKIK